MAYVYRHIRLDKNIPFYIGISKVDSNKYERAYNADYRHRNKNWIRVYNKTEICVEILFENVEYEFAKMKEIEFIGIYKRQCDGGSLVNITLGGDGVLGFENPTLSERNRAGIWKGKRHSVETRALMSSNNKGKVFSESHKINIGKSKKGAHIGVRNPNYRGAITVFKDGEEIGEYAGLRDVANNIGLSSSHISTSLTNGTKTGTGYTFKRIPNEIQKA